MECRVSKLGNGLCAVAVASLLFASPAWAKGPFDGLEMDVIAPGETPQGATSRIALPTAVNRPGSAPLSMDGASGYQDAIADSLLRGDGGQSRAALTTGVPPPPVSPKP